MTPVVLVTYAADAATALLVLAATWAVYGRAPRARHATKGTGVAR